MRLKAGRQDEYIRRHKEIWSQVLADLKRAGVQKMSIFMSGLELFLHMEVDNYPEAVRILDECPESVRWEEYMAPIMENASGDAYDPENPYPEGLPEVFYWEND